MDLKPYSMTLWVEASQEYGRWVYRPKCKKSKVFAAIAGTKTLTQPILLHIRALGFDIQTEVAKPESLSV